MGGNTGVCMGGWFRREIKALSDLRGLKLRSLGLGGEVYRRLGATPQTTPPAEMLTSLQSGVIDGAEFVGPGSDIALGLYRVAPFYYGPGFNKPNGTGECLVALKAWETLDAELKAIVAHACAAEASFALAEMERLNVEALAALTTRNNVQLRTFPADLIAAVRKQAADVLAELAGPQRQGAPRARFLCGVPCARGRVVAHFAQSGAGGAGRVAIFRLTSLLVIAGHSRPKDGVASLAYDPAIHGAFLQRIQYGFLRGASSWMPGSSLHSGPPKAGPGCPGMMKKRNSDVSCNIQIFKQPRIIVPILCGVGYAGVPLFLPTNSRIAHRAQSRARCVIPTFGRHDSWLFVRAAV